MRKLLWMILLFGAYVWAITSGHDHAILEKGKWAYETLVAWFDDADLDFQVSQVKQKEKVRKRHRRWD